MKYRERGEAIAKAQNKDRGAIPYRPQYTKITGTVEASLLLQQIWYWWEKQGGPFYKYRAPCSAENYRQGDSWLEELAFSTRQFDNAISIVGTKVTKGVSKKDARRYSLVVYWTDSSRMTWYELNEELFYILVGLAYEDGDLLTDWRPAELLGTSQIANYLEGLNLGITFSTEITTETTTSPCERENTKQEDAEIFDRDFPPRAPSASLKETLVQRQAQDRPWLGWGEQSTALVPYSGIDVSSIKKVGFLLESEFGMAPVWADKQRARQWVRECAQLWEAAGGSLPLIHTAATHGREQGLMLSRPGSLFNIVRGIAAEAKSQPLPEDRPPPGPRPAHRIQARKESDEAHTKTVEGDARHRT